MTLSPIFEILALDVRFIEKTVGLLCLACVALNHDHHILILLRLSYHGTSLVRGLNPYREDLTVLLVVLGGGEQGLGLHSNIFNVLHPFIRLILQEIVRHEHLPTFIH
jgi:hypothetical protein